MRSGRRRGVSALFLFPFLLPLGAAAWAQDGKPQGGSLAIADFEGGKLETLSGLALAAITDEQLGGTSEARLTLTHPGAQGSRGALRISFLMTDGFPRPFAQVSALLGKEGLATDMSAYRGLRFQARSKGGTFFAGVGQFSGQAVSYRAPFEIKPEWTLVEIPFDTLKRYYPPASTPSAFVPKDLVTIDFSAGSQLRGQFDLEIDQLELYK